MSSDPSLLTVRQAIEKLSNCNPDNHIQFFDSDNAELLNVVSIEESTSEGVVYLHHSNPEASDNIVSKVDPDEESCCDSILRTIFG